MNYTFSGRYTNTLMELLDDLGAKKELRVVFDDDYSGEVDVDILLKDGRVFSYHYYYGSCSGCDKWEDEGIDDKQIKAAMRKGASFFDNMKQYKIWRKQVEEKK